MIQVPSTKIFAYMHPGASYKGGRYRGGRGNGSGAAAQEAPSVNQAPNNYVQDSVPPGQRRGGYGRGSGNRPPRGGDRAGHGGFRGRGNDFGRGRGRGFDGGPQSFLSAAYQDPAIANAQLSNNPQAHQTLAMPLEDDLSTWRQKDFQALVKAFVENDEEQSLTFPPTLNPTQRNTLHRIAMAFQLDHKSSGVGAERRLTLSKASGTVAMQQRKTEAAINGERIKTIDGFQGAQMLYDRFIDYSKIGEVTDILQRHRIKMVQNIKLEANRAVAKERKFKATQPGLSAPPRYTRDNKTFQSLQSFRHSLPTYKRRDEIIHAVKNNDVVVVCGDTGCGKTTQIPQMLYDANVFPTGSEIICTQPRRISALSVAARVAAERGEACGDSCGYIIRFENVTSRNTHIVYVTTGILLRRLHSEPELSGVACIIVDEVHERDLDTDFCLLLLRDRLAAQRANPHKYPQKLKIVVMSATVQIETLMDYFSGSNHGQKVPLVSIPGTLFPVKEFFLEDAVAWVGGSKSAATTMAFLEQRATEPDKAVTADMSLYEKLKTSVFNDRDRDVESMVPYDLLSKLIVHIHKGTPDLSGSVLVFLPGWAAITRIADMLRRSDVARELSVLMLHSSLTSAEQQRVFLPPPKRYRKVVLATSIAETSITIDDVVYVIDSGLVKGTAYDPSGNTSALQAMLIAQANGVQRKGRAGRCREGVCVHLLPKSVYEGLPKFLDPEIVRSPLEEICLQVKAIHSEERCSSVLARAMSPPPANSVVHAVSFLTEIGAFTEEEEYLTNLGRALAQLPLHPLLGKMLFAAAIFGVLDSVATIAAGLSVKSPFVKPLNHQKAACHESLARLDNGDLSDHLCVLKLHKGWVASGRSFQYAAEKFADATTLRSLDRTKNQLIRLVQFSPLLRRLKEPLREASRNNDNTGLVRLTMLWSLYPRIATLEYRANRNTNAPNVFCWDNKPATFSMSSALAFAKRRELHDNTFVVYYERMQLEAKLNLFDSSVVSPVDVALCTRQLTVRPLLSIPEFLLKDDDSKLAPPVRLDLDLLEDKSTFAGMFFDGDKKLYVARKEIAAALEMCRQCMDYYLALCIKKLRADAFPVELVKAIALLIGFPLSEKAIVADTAHTAFSISDEGSGADPAASPENLPSFVRGGESEDNSSDDEAPIIVDDAEESDLGLSDEQRRKLIMTFGDLAVLRHANIIGLDGKPDAAQVASVQIAREVPVVADDAAVVQGNSKASGGVLVDDDDDSDEDDIVAKPGDLQI